MDSTKVDDMLIEMISPKMKEIEDKFANGEGLTQDDINTLLLKSQYNHINHLDKKLDEVTDSVVALENQFHDLKDEFKDLKNEFEILKISIEHTIQKALNRNMVLLFGMMFFLLTLSKFIDTFAQ